MIYNRLTEAKSEFEKLRASGVKGGGFKMQRNSRIVWEEDTVRRCCANLEKARADGHDTT